MSISMRLPEVRVLLHSSVLLPGTQVAQKKGVHLKPHDLESISDGALVYSVLKIPTPKDRIAVFQKLHPHQTQPRFIEVPQKILWVGPTRKLPREWRNASPRQKIRVTDLERNSLLMPGWIDPHTHLVFAGDRAHEFARRCAGESYQKIAEEGGGIQHTVNETRRASETQLFLEAARRLESLMRQGVRGLEIKSGYGLDFESEHKLLKVIRRLQRAYPEIRIQSTYLGAHAVPKEFKNSAQWIQEICKNHLPRFRELAHACDIFVDEGYFSHEDAELFLSRAKSLGFQIKIHADEMGNTESAALAAKLGCLSADHLLKVSNQGIQALSRSNTVGVLLPTTALYLKTEYAPARKLLDAGAKIAIGSDFNPGTSYCLSPTIPLTLSALYMQMNSAELFAAVTTSASYALGWQDQVGPLIPGAPAFFSGVGGGSFEELFYRLGRL